MDDEQYFGIGLPGYISNSKLGLLNPSQDGSVAKFNRGFDETKGDFFKIGSSVHALILEGDKFSLSEMEVPKGATKFIMETVYKILHVKNSKVSFDEALLTAVRYHNYYGGAPGEKRLEALKENGKEYYDYLVNGDTQGKITLAPDMKTTVLECVTSVKNNKAAMELLEPMAEEEFEMLNTKLKFYEDVITCDYRSIRKKSTLDIPLKAKVDNWAVDLENKILYVNDLKTTGSPIDNFMGSMGMEVSGYATINPVWVSGSFHKFHYYRQMYMYTEMVKLLATERYGFDDTWTVKVNMVVVETNYKKTCKVFEVSQDLLDIGKTEFLYLMDLVHKNKDKIDCLKEVINKDTEYEGLFTDINRETRTA